MKIGSYFIRFSFHKPVILGGSRSGVSFKEEASSVFGIAWALRSSYRFSYRGKLPSPQWNRATSGIPWRTMNRRRTWTFVGWSCDQFSCTALRTHSTIIQELNLGAYPALAQASEMVARG